MKAQTIDGFSARINEMMEGRDGLTYRGTIRRAGKKVGTFYNGGYGGPDDFDFDDPTETAAFYAAVEKNAPTTLKIKDGKKTITIKIVERDAKFLSMLLGD